MRLHHTEVLAEFAQPGPDSPQSIILPADALGDCAGRGNGLVTLESNGTGAVQVRWDDAGKPQVRHYESPASQTVPAFPSVPAKMSPVGSALLKALADAGGSASKEAVRYATNRIQLRGRAGQIVGTNSRELLIQSGFRFPFPQDVLIPNSPIFGCKELAESDEFAVGAEGGRLTIQAGAWTLHFPIDAASHYPKVDEAIPKSSRKATICSLSPDDVALLSRSIPQLGNAGVPLTLDLNGQAVIRSRSDGQARPTELLLRGTQVTGTAVRIGVNPTSLTRALELGFVEFSVIDASTPIVCRDERRTFVFMPLAQEDIIAPQADALPNAATEAERPSQARVPDRKRPTPAPTSELRLPSQNGVLPQPATPAGQQNGSSSNGAYEVLAEAIALKEVLRDAYTRTQQLLVALQRQSKQTKAFRSALGSLRQLGHLADA